ncbi:MAG: zinc ribbon domain-containing protein [Chloroflexota bacterium]
MSIDEQLAQRFVCCKCHQSGAYVKRFSATGTGLSKLFDIQHNVFIAASCGSCGYTEIYNPDILESRSRTTDVLDILFGG